MTNFYRMKIEYREIIKGVIKEEVVSYNSISIVFSC